MSEDIITRLRKQFAERLEEEWQVNYGPPKKLSASAIAWIEVDALERRIVKLTGQSNAS